MNVLQLILPIAAYLLGSIPFGVLVARSKGIDIMSVGSGNVGATNVYRTLGWGPGLLVFFLDVAKGALPALVTNILLGDKVFSFGVGMVAVLGHGFSPWLKFKGGKGIATGLGALLGSSPLVACTVLGVFAVVLAVSRYVSLASILAAGSLVGFGVLFRDPVPMLIGYALLFVFVVVKHSSNIRRLIAGTERRFSFRSSPSAPTEAENA